MATKISPTVNVLPYKRGKLLPAAPNTSDKAVPAMRVNWLTWLFQNNHPLASTVVTRAAPAPVITITALANWRSRINTALEGMNIHRETEDEAKKSYEALLEIAKVLAEIEEEGLSLGDLYDNKKYPGGPDAKQIKHRYPAPCTDECVLKEPRFFWRELHNLFKYASGTRYRNHTNRYPERTSAKQEQSADAQAKALAAIELFLTFLGAKTKGSLQILDRNKLAELSPTALVQACQDLKTEVARAYQDFNPKPPERPEEVFFAVPAAVIQAFGDLAQQNYEGLFEGSYKKNDAILRELGSSCDLMQKQLGHYAHHYKEYKPQNGTTETQEEYALRKMREALTTNFGGAANQCLLQTIHSSLDKFLFTWAQLDERQRTEVLQQAFTPTGQAQNKPGKILETIEFLATLPQYLTKQNVTSGDRRIDASGHNDRLISLVENNLGLLETVKAAIKTLNQPAPTPSAPAR